MKGIFNMEKEKLKKKYSKPNLEKLGDLRSLTLGPSPGAGDSGGPGTFLVVSGAPVPAGFPDPGGFNQPGGGSGSLP